MSERASEVTELKRNLAQALRDKEQLQEVAVTFTYSFICVPHFSFRPHLPANGDAPLY